MKEAASVAVFVRTDAQIRQDVLDGIELDPRFEAAELGVEVDDGVVTLNGTVSTYEKVLVAADICAVVPGVTAVANRLTVKARGVDTVDDTSVAQAIQDALKLDPIAPDEHLQVIVRDGIVTLGGTVAHAYQRTSAVEATKRIHGVRAIRNNIRVNAPCWSDADMRAEIEAAIHRQMPIAGKNVRVSVEEGVVTLSGEVRFTTERDQAEKNAWSPAPVRRVINRLTTTW
jgi:osmotically-inducible protein OsmY